MRKRRKHSTCLNCGELLDPKHNYCPFCGQENTDNQVSIGLLIKEFTSNFFSLDSRFGRTFKPFLLSPGKITNAFNEGKRVKYANPIRWYLVISIFHFFFLSKMLKPSVEEMRENVFLEEDIKLDTIVFDSLNSLPDTTDAWPFSVSQKKLVHHLLKHTTLTDDQIYDTLGFSRSWMGAFATKKFIRTSRESTATVNSYLLRQIPVIIFFILPMYAGLLKLFFWRKGLYIKHLIHSIHLHAFLFFLLGWVWVLALGVNGIAEYGWRIALLLTAAYSFVSFRKVYKITIWQTLLKMSLIGGFYFILLAIPLILGVLISLAFY